MGNWHISIEGMGSHHNKDVNDADQLAAAFVKELQAAGQKVERAVITVGSKTNLESTSGEPKETIVGGQSETVGT